MLELFTNKYPYTDFHELNLDWLISKVIAMNVKLDNFVSLNTIKYADPIGWDITKQYEANTVVLDQSSGIAYLSSKPVPAGVSISNPAYWSVIFDLQQIIGSINNNITYHNDGTSPTTTFTLAVGDWVLWNSKLYKVIQAMSPGYAYIEGSNIEAHSVEELVNEYVNTLYTYIGQLSDLTTSDTTSIVNAINSLLSDINTTIGDLSDLTTSDITSVVNAINSVVDDINTLNTNVGDLSTLATTDKSSVVNAINEINTRIDNLKSTIYINVKDYGATGDGVTDDTSAILDALAVAETYDLGATLFFPAGEYLITQTITLNYITGHGLGGISILGEGRYASVIFSNNDIDLIKYIGGNTDPAENDKLFGVSVREIYFRYTGGSSTSTGISFTNCQQVFMCNVRIRYFKTGVYLSNCVNSTFVAVGISANVTGARGFDIGDRSVSNSYISCFFAASGNATGLLAYSTGFYADRGNIADQNIIYFDCGNATTAIDIDGQNMTINQTGDINIIDLVCETNYGVALRNINFHGNANIIGGWFNCKATDPRSGVYLTNAQGININGTIFVNNMGTLPLTDPKYALTTVGTGCSDIKMVNCIIRNQIAVSNGSGGKRFMFSNNQIILDGDSSDTLVGIASENSIVTNNTFKGNCLRFARLYSGASKSIMKNNIASGTASGTAFQDDSTGSIVNDNIN